MKAILGLTLCALISTRQLHQQEAPVTQPQKTQETATQNKNQLSIDKVVIVPMAVFTKPIVVNIFGGHRHPHRFGRFGQRQFSGFGGYQGRPFSSPFNTDDNEDDSESRFRPFPGQNFNRNEQNSQDQNRQDGQGVLKSLRIIRLNANNDSDNKDQSSSDNQKKQETTQTTQTAKQTNDDAKQQKKQDEKSKEQVKADLPLVLPLNTTETTTTTQASKSHLFDEGDEYY